jgi:hypothetical protein
MNNTSFKLKGFASFFVPNIYVKFAVHVECENGRSTLQGNRLTVLSAGDPVLLGSSVDARRRRDPVLLWLFHLKVGSQRRP